VFFYQYFVIFLFITLHFFSSNSGLSTAAQSPKGMGWWRVDYSNETSYFLWTQTTTLWRSRKSSV